MQRSSKPKQLRVGLQDLSDFAKVRRISEQHPSQQLHQSEDHPLRVAFGTFSQQQVAYQSSCCKVQTLNGKNKAIRNFAIKMKFSLETWPPIDARDFDSWTDWSWHFHLFSRNNFWLPINAKVTLLNDEMYRNFKKNKNFEVVLNWRNFCCEKITEK